MPRMKFELDAAQVTDPMNWAETELTLDRDEFGALTYGVTNEFQFIDDGWTALSNLFDAGMCGEAAFVLSYDEGSGYTTLLEGKTSPGLIKYNLDDHIATATILEENYFELIEKNKSIEVFIGVGRSKDDSSYTGATKQAIDLFNPATGGYTALNVESYTVADAFDDIVQFMTNTTLGVTNNVTELDTLCICSGNAINNYGGAGDYKPSISFEDLMSEIRKLYNVGYYVDTATAKVVIDYYDSIYDTTSSVSITTANKVTRYIDQDKLYSRLDIGSTKTQTYDGGAFSWPDIRYTSHKSEKYALAGTCNSGTVLDLVLTELIIDSNVIEDIVINAVLATPLFEYEKDVICFEANGALSQATKFDIFNIGVAPYSYNENLTNQLRVPRFVGVIPNDLITYLGDGNDYFEATKTTVTNETGPFTVLARVDYSNVVSDPNGNYDNAAGQYHYTAPADGFYRFSCSILINNIVIDPAGVSLDVQLTQERRPAGGGATIETKTDSQIITTDQTVVYFPGGFYMNALEEMNVSLRVDDTGPGPGVNTYDFAGGTFECVEATSGGGTFETFDIEGCNILVYEGDFPMTLTEFTALRDAPYEAIEINLPDGTTKKGWCNPLNYNLNSGRASLTMITNNNL